MVEINLKQIIKADFYEKLIIKLNTPGLDHKTAFFRLLAVSQKAGLGLRDSLQSIFRSEKHSGLKMIIADLIKQLTQGATLATAMANHMYFFGEEEIELVKAAELTGNMPETLREIGDELENMQKIRSKIRSAMAYPATLIVFTILAVAVLLIKVIPTIISLFPDPSKLPRITVFMIQSSNFMIQFWWLIAIIFGSLIFGYTVAYSQVLPFKMLIDKILISTPVVSDVTKTYYLYRFSKLLSDFYKAGVNPTVSLEQMSNIFENYRYKKKLLEMKKDLVAGFGFSESMEGSELFDALLVQIIVVGENTGNVGEIMKTMSEFYKDSLESKIATLMGVVEPVLMAIIAVVIGGVVASIFLPMADLVNVLGSGF